MRTRAWWKALGRLALALAGLALSYIALLAAPQMLFGSSCTARNLTIYSDRPFSAAAGVGVLAAAQEKLTSSPLYSSRNRYRIFVCNTRWRRFLFFLPAPSASGASYYPFTTNVFLSGARIEENRLIAPSGTVVSDYRTLDHFIAHEITHVLTGQAMGGLRLHRLPDWSKEGYSEYVAGIEGFDYAQAVKAFLAEAPEMSQSKPAPYRRYHLLMTYVLERKHWSLLQALDGSATQGTVESMLRAEPRDR
jgi:hypothetical protein